MKPLGVYFHIPFCRKKCAYCDFYSLARMDELMPGYQSALLGHLRETAPRLKGYCADTVYFGGGTPSFYGARRLAELLGALSRLVRVDKNAEITVECNPESVAREELKRLKKAGVNRLSIGVQCADDAILRDIGRVHTFDMAKNAVAAARDAGFDNLSLDLIYGLPNQTMSGWRESLDAVLALGPEHISCYGLELKPGTPLALKSAPLPSQDMQADMYIYTSDRLREAGYEHYEVSNFAKPGRRSRHNLKYWDGGEYLGFGAAAASDFDDQRFTNVADARRYIEGIRTGGAVVAENDRMTTSERAGEYIMLRLRTDSGICEEEYFERFRGTFSKIEPYLVRLESAGFCKKIGTRWVLTPKGFLMSNTIIVDLLEVL